MLAGFLLFAAAYSVPHDVKQGNVLHVEGPAGAATAVLGERTVKLFAQKDGRLLGLIPINAEFPAGPATVRILDNAGQTVQESTVQVVDGGFPSQNVEVSTRMSSLRPKPGETETLRAFAQTVSDTRLWREPFLPPVRGCVNSLYGLQRLHNGQPAGRRHLGVDMHGANGVAVRAPADGVVRLARKFQMPGGTLGIDHGQGVLTSYYHLSRLAVKEGQRVKRGDVVAYVGATGFATGPHLHWNVLVNGVPVNPAQWAPAIRACP